MTRVVAQMRPAPPASSRPAASTAFAVAVLPALAALVLYVFGIGTPALWLDEAATAGESGRSLSGLLGFLAERDAGLGAYYLFMHGWTSFGDGEAWLRLPSAVAMAVAVGMLADLGRRWWGSGAGVAAGLLLALSPMASRYAQEARPYALAVLAAVAAAWSLWRAAGYSSPTDAPAGSAGSAGLAGSARRWWIAYATAVAALGVVHVVALVVLVAHPLLLLAAFGRTRRAQGVDPQGTGAQGSGPRGAGRRGGRTSSPPAPDWCCPPWSRWQRSVSGRRSPGSRPPAGPPCSRLRGDGRQRCVPPAARRSRGGRCAGRPAAPHVPNAAGPRRPDVLAGRPAVRAGRPRPGHAGVPSALPAGVRARPGAARRGRVRRPRQVAQDGFAAGEDDRREGSVRRCGSRPRRVGGLALTRARTRRHRARARHPVRGRGDRGRLLPGDGVQRTSPPCRRCRTTCGCAVRPRWLDGRLPDDVHRVWVVQPDWQHGDPPGVTGLRHLRTVDVPGLRVSLWARSGPTD